MSILCIISIITITFFGSTKIIYAEEDKNEDVIKTELYNLINVDNMVSEADTTEDTTYQFVNTERVDINSYKSTTVDVTSTDPNFLDIVEENSNTVMRSASEHNYREKYDNAVSHLAYSYVYFQESTVNSDSYCKITRVSGGYIVNDSSCQVISQSVNYGQASSTKSYSTTYTPTSTTKSWSVVPPSSWQPVKTNVSIGCYIGARYTLKIQRYSTPWTLELENFIYNVPGSIWP